MKENIGLFDKLLRLGIALLLVFLYVFDFVNGIIGIGFLLVAIVLTLTSLTQLCPLYFLLGCNSTKSTKTKV